MKYQKHSFQGSSSDATTSSTAPASDLTIPLMLPKISTRAQKSDPPANTIPLNIPVKAKRRPATSPPPIDLEKSSSVLSSLSEEELIRKAAEMLGESSETEKPATPTGAGKKPATPTGGAKKPPSASALPVFSPNVPPPNVAPPNVPPPNVPPPFIYNTPPPTIVAPPGSAAPAPVAKRSKLDLPPVPGLEDET